MKYIKYQITSDAAYQWVGWCEKEAYRLDKLRKPGSTTRKFYQFIGNITAEIILTDLTSIIRIWGDASGFICHPQTDSFPGGITSDLTQITAQYTYPLIDSDDGSFILTFDSTQSPVWEVAREPENYGNLDWMGSIIPGSEVDTQILSWRGVPGRQINLDPTVNITGLSQFAYSIVDSSTGLETDYYTCFNGNLYSSGDILLVAPIDEDAINSRILGAGYLNNLLVLICSVQSTSIGTNGLHTYRERVYIQNEGGWTQLSDRTGGEAFVPYFFSQDGSQAVRSSEYYSISETDAVKTSLTNGSGIVIYNTSPYNVTKNGQWLMYPDFIDSTLTQYQITFTSTDQTSSTLNDITTQGIAQVYYPGTEPTLSVTGNDSATVGTIYSASSSDAVAPQGVVWSFTGGTISSTGEILTITGCGTVTVTAVDSCGRSASKQVMVPSGVWVQVQDDTFTPDFEGLGSCEWTWRTDECTVGILKYKVTSGSGRLQNTVYFDCIDLGPLVGPCGRENYCNDLLLQYCNGVNRWTRQTQVITEIITYEWRCA